MYNNEQLQIRHQTDQAFVRLLCLVLNQRDTVTDENKAGYKQTLLFLRNQLIFNNCPTLTPNVKDGWIDKIHNTIMNL